MKVSSFMMMVSTLVVLLSAINCFWIGRLLGTSIRSKFRIAYATFTVITLALYISLGLTGRMAGIEALNLLLYIGPFWTVLQLLLVLAWPFSKIAGNVQRWCRGARSATESAAAPMKSSANPPMSRREFIFQAAILPPVAMTGINTVGVLDAEFRAVLRRIELAYPELPDALDGLKIGHMTDVHIGTYVSARDVQKMAALLQQESPDLLTITGDFVDDVAMLPHALQMMKPLLDSVPLGTWFCMGNHEHLRGAGPIRQILKNHGIHILDNQHRNIPYNGAQIVLTGVDYPMGVSTSDRPLAAKRILESACGTSGTNEFSILMAHHPDFLPAAFGKRIGLTLSGHTHGGQVGWGQGSVFQFLYPFMRGVYSNEQSFGFVSSGAGHWMPFRLNCPPEVSSITLKRKA